MAYVKGTGSGYSVRQGNTGRPLKWFKSRKKAKEYVRALHKKYDPKRSNRGQSARRRNR